MTSFHVFDCTEVQQKNQKLRNTKRMNILFFIIFETAKEFLSNCKRISLSTNHSE